MSQHNVPEGSGDQAAKNPGRDNNIGQFRFTVPPS